MLRGGGQLDLHGGQRAFGLAQLTLESKLARGGLPREKTQETKQPLASHSPPVAVYEVRPPGFDGFLKAPWRATPPPSVAGSPSATGW